jgi:outer membrane protein assembly factor BamB
MDSFRILSVSGGRAAWRGLVLLGALVLGCTPERETPSRLLCEEDWPKGLQWGSPAADEALALGAGPDGALYVTGFEEATWGESRLGPSEDSKGFVLRLGARGEVEWKQRLDTPGTDTVEAVSVEPDGRLWVAGRTTGAFEGYGAQGQFDGFLASLTPGGEPRVLLQWGDDRPQKPARLVRTSDGALVVAGYDDVFVPSNYVESWEDPFVMRADPDAEGCWSVSWNQRFGSPESDMITGLLAGPEGDIYVSGQVMEGSRKGPFVQRRDARGDVRWSRRLSTIGFDTAAALALGPDGDVLVAGSTFAVPEGDGSQEAYLARLDANTGEVKWRVTAGSSGADFVTALAVDASGHAYVAGETDGQFDGATGGRGAFDVFVLAFDPNGKWLGAWQHGSADGGDDHPNDVAVDACGRVFVAGYTTGAFVEGSEVPGGRDAFVVPVRF